MTGEVTYQNVAADATLSIVGNTLTGEFSRAGLMRLRWPYVRRVVAASLREEGWSPEQTQAFLQGVEIQFKSPFPPIGEESLAGGLANTIAGRICNHLDEPLGNAVVREFSDEEIMVEISENIRGADTLPATACNAGSIRPALAEVSSGEILAQNQS